MQGLATVANISLRCWRHNQYEAQLIFGPNGPSIVREGCASPQAWSGPDRAEELEQPNAQGKISLLEMC
jgi:hypothetical protein